MKKVLLTLAAFAGLTLLFILMAGGFVSPLDSETLPSKGEPLAERVLTQVELVSLPQWQHFTGTLVADQQATVSARLTAQVADVLVNIGDVVEPGDVLIRLDNQDLDARVRQTEQGLASRQAQLNQARKDYQRISSLQQSQAVSKSQVDQALSALESAEADFKQAQASVTEAQATLGYSLITAPFHGVITGKLVNKGDTATPGLAMLSLYNPASLVLESEVAAGYRSLLKVGQVWPVDLPELGVELMGQIREITPAADTSSRTVLVRLYIEPDQGVELYAGLFARLKLELGQETWLTIPESARYRIGQLEYVKWFNGEHLVPRLVQTQRSVQGQLLVRQGLEAGEKILAQVN